MNDLAEKALHGLDVARRRVRDQPMPYLAGLGFVTSSAVVVAGARVGAARATRGLTTWLGLENPRGARAGDSLPGTVMLAALVALLLLWLLVVELVRRTRQPESRVWMVGLVWLAPFAIGPPLLDTSVYSYAAYGLLQRAGRDPYVDSPSDLGRAHLVAAIDPGARGTPSSAGPLGTMLQHLSVSISSGSALGAVLVLRALGVVAAIMIGRLAAELAGSRRAEAVSLTALNPLVLLYVVSSPHLEGTMLALVLAALVAANQRRWLRAVALASVAAAITGQAFVVVLVIVVAHRLGRRSGGWRRLGRDVLVAAGITLAAAVGQPGGFGWVPAIGKQFSAHPPFTIAGAIGRMLSPIVQDASFDDLAAGGRITALAAAACAIGYLLVTARQRAVERTAGYALLTIGLLAPVLNPWYLLWGTLCLAPVATGPRRTAVIALCVTGCLLTPPGFSGGVSDAITGVALVLVAGVVAGVLVVGHRRDARVAISAGR
ncbi:MAG TPA: polyprenol phosphomannose-dependent alpha 1,6 mannosyltransferase MptB [Jatrophihabitans sp.]|uniref:polyprenol phosphomannose-dependent alpha 1,6 mannosyltransferase MptB n=1 Tax=Jatrophihabitans sp. TaxID=1932789 RepID=UPI002E012BE8|nr:polyprenol phosphomannose-dependent alpha 1,6 mannosyltransferase MptB [Jatrophihabitans sp.]